MTNLDIALHKDKFVINAKSTIEIKECLTKWEKVERLSLIDIERTIPTFFWWFVGGMHYSIIFYGSKTYVYGIR